MLYRHSLTIIRIKKNENFHPVFLPDKSIAHFVPSFWMVENKEDKEIPVTVLPYGMVDLSLMKIKSGKGKISLRGIDTTFRRATIPAKTKIFSVAFKLLAVQYLFGNSVKEALNEEIKIPNNFWQLART